MERRAAALAAIGARVPGSRTKSTPRVLGQLLLSAGAIDEARLESALLEQRETRERLGEILVRRGMASEALAYALAEQLRLPYAPPPLRPEESAKDVADRKMLARMRVLPLALDNGTLYVATADPLDAAALDDLRFQTGRRIEPVVVSRTAITDALAARAESDTLTDILRGPGGSDGQGGDEVDALRRASEAAPIIALVEHVLERACAQRASDVHLEPVDAGLRVRVRVDGILRELAMLPARVTSAVASRIKIMADLDIAVRRRPQDGRAELQLGDRRLALRVSTLPAHGGEKVVIRLLEPTAAATPLDALGMTEDVRQAFRGLVRRSHGVLLVTGPTGSGKTTTLYSALATLDRATRNIVTLEDPVEYHLPGITQVQVQPRAGLSFADALRSVLRQDPDVIMVGELRDRETVETAMAAALTGHLVLATLHTNDAPTAATRLSEMGVPPYLVAAALIGVLAQRLARRRCTCKTGPAHAQSSPADPASEHGWNECERCSGSGFHGRTGVFELMVTSAPLRGLLSLGASAQRIRRLARAQGMRTLAEDARRLVSAGLTTESEVRSLLDANEDTDYPCPACRAKIRRTYRWCPICGMPVRMQCKCGVAVEQGWKRCPRCGRALAVAAESAATAQSTAAGAGVPVVAD